MRAILLHEWDPIGVAHAPEAADEYDQYADEAYVMLMDRNAGAPEIAGYLFGIATEHMGLSDADLRRKSDEVAERLVLLRPEFSSH